jgi:hypothetical protein
MLDFMTFVPGTPIVPDATNPAYLTSITTNGTLTFEFEAEVESATCHSNLLLPREPWQVARPWLMSSMAGTCRFGLLRRLTTRHHFLAGKSNSQYA